MNAIPGVHLSLLIVDSNAAAEVNLREDGFIGRLNSSTVTIAVGVWPFWKAQVVTVDDDKNIEPVVAEQDGRFLHTTYVCERDGVMVAETDNDLLIVSPDANAILTVYAVSVISQDGEFFLAVDKMFQPELFSDVLNPGEVLVPQFERGFNTGGVSWLQLMPFVREVAQFLHAKPADISSYRGEPTVNIRGLRQINGLTEGRVKYWNSVEGRGGVVFIGHGLCTVDWTDIERPEGGRKYLIPGEVVRATGFMRHKRGKYKGSSWETALGVTPRVSFGDIAEALKAAIA